MLAPYPSEPQTQNLLAALRRHTQTQGTSTQDTADLLSVALEQHAQRHEDATERHDERKHHEHYQPTVQAAANVLQRAEKRPLLHRVRDRDTDQAAVDNFDKLCTERRRRDMDDTNCSAGGDTTRSAY